jgi:hypothetical protein
LKKIEWKIKNIEKDAANYAKLIDRNDRVELPPIEEKRKGPSGVYLLQNRFMTQLPVNESM